MIITKLKLASKVVMSEVKGNLRKPCYFFDVPEDLQLLFVTSSTKTIYTNWFK